MAVGMTFVIVNKDIDLSVGSTYGLVGRGVLAASSTPPIYDMGVVSARSLPASRSGPLIGLINGVLVTFLRVPAFIATLTMLLIGRGFILGLTGGKSILYPVKAASTPGSSSSARPTPGASTTRSSSRFVIVAVGAVVLAKTRWGYETFATGGNEQAADLCRHPDALGAHPRLSPLVALRRPSPA